MKLQGEKKKETKKGQEEMLATVFHNNSIKSCVHKVCWVVSKPQLSSRNIPGVFIENQF